MDTIFGLSAPQNPQTRYKLKVPKILYAGVIFKL